MNEIQRAGILWYNTGITDVIGVRIRDCMRVAIAYVFRAFVGIRVPT